MISCFFEDVIEIVKINELDFIDGENDVHFK
jgi:hypothetical protein